MRILNKALLVSSFGGSAMLMAACPASLDDECAKGACVAASTSSGGEGGTDTGTDGPPIDPCATPTNPPDPKCLDDSTTLFVSPTGSDANPGTKAAPLGTIGAAVKAATTEKKRAYICEGAYAENILIAKSIALIGGINCSWSGKGARPKIVPAKGVAITVTKATTASLTELSIAANADPQVKSDSAVAVFISESQSILLKNVDITAGPGMDGKPSTNGIDSPNYSGAIAPRGVDTSDATAADPPVCGTCADTNFSAGGKGAPAPGLPLPGSAKPPVGVNNAGGTTGPNCNDGKDGDNGLPAAAAKGAAKPGSLTAQKWEPSAGENGGNGNPGQGGGGAGSNATLGGGSGGCGGCGGTGGSGGGSGGSSFAVLSFGSSVTIEDSTLTSGSGGKGFAGGNGQDGQVRGGAGNGVCTAGRGGHGAGGGGGGGGGGGHSVTVGYTGTPPNTTRTTMTTTGEATPGGGGTNGDSQGSPGAAGTSGVKGSSEKVLAL